MRINVEEGRGSPEDMSWNLPPWGHPLAQGVFPLFIVIDEHLFPIGTAFSVGKKMRFLMTAEHTIGEAIKREPSLERLRNEGRLPPEANLEHSQLCVLYHRGGQGGMIDFMIWPIEHVNGAPPTDIVFAFPKFVEGHPTVAFPLTFGLPDIGTRVFSAGYTDVEVPENGVPLSAVRAGTFDWRGDYSHRFHVVEGRVERIFTQRFAGGYLEGPCFLFDGEIPHGLSGGPVFTKGSHVLGVNSAAATRFFTEPKSLASLLYPLLPIRLTAALQEGNLRLKANIPLIDLIAQGSMTTDGSEQHVGLIEDGDSFIVSPVCKREMAPFVHDDFRGYQEGRSASESAATHYRLHINRQE